MKKENDVFIYVNTTNSVYEVIDSGSCWVRCRTEDGVTVRLQYKTMQGYLNDTIFLII